MPDGLGWTFDSHVDDGYQPAPGEQEEWEAAQAELARHEAEARDWCRRTGSPEAGMPGCCCYGGNTPYLIGRCPCRGIERQG